MAKKYRVKKGDRVLQNCARLLINKNIVLFSGFCAELMGEQPVQFHGTEGPFNQGLRLCSHLFKVFLILSVNGCFAGEATRHNGIYSRDCMGLLLLPFYLLGMGPKLPAPLCPGTQPLPLCSGDPCHPPLR